MPANSTPPVMLAHLSGCIFNDWPTPGIASLDLGLQAIMPPAYELEPYSPNAVINNKDSICSSTGILTLFGHNKSQHSNTPTFQHFRSSYAGLVLALRPSPESGLRCRLCWGDRRDPSSEHFWECLEHRRWWRRSSQESGVIQKGRLRFCPKLR